MATYCIKIKTANAAFGDSPSHEIARILNEIAERLGKNDSYICFPPSKMTLVDINGNTVGEATYG